MLISVYEIIFYLLDEMVFLMFGLVFGWVIWIIFFSLVDMFLRMLFGYIGYFGQMKKVLGVQVLIGFLYVKGNGYCFVGQIIFCRFGDIF